MADLFVLGEQSRPNCVAYDTIGNWAYASSGVPAVVPLGVRESLRGGEEATAVAPSRAMGRFEVAAMIAARRFAVDRGGASLDATSCRAASHLGASLDENPNRDVLRAARRLSTQADRSVAERHRFAAASCRVEFRLGAFLDSEPNPETLHVVRGVSRRADRDVAGSHQIVFHCAKAIHRAVDYRVHRAVDCRVHRRVLLRVRTGSGLALSGGAAALRRAQAVCNRACAKADRSGRLNRL
jgi:hypothetical protein